MPSKISGKDKIVYTNEKIEQVIPLFNESIVTDSIQAPFAYIIPQAYQNIVEILQLHGIKVNRVKSTEKIEVKKYRFDEKTTWALYPYEGRITVNTKYYTFKDSILTRPNDYIIYTNQRGIRVLLHLLEPKSSDSFVYWGFFNAIFERKEYYEDYVLEKLAEVMYEKDQLVRKEFDQKLQSDSIFASSPQQRLEFFIVNLHTLIRIGLFILLSEFLIQLNLKIEFLLNENLRDFNESLLLSEEFIFN